MGYDMHWNHHDEALDAPCAEAEVAFDAAVEKRDALERGSAAHEAAHSVVHARHADLQAARSWYFRLNIRGMTVAHNELYAVGVMTEASEPVWPKAPSDEWFDEDDPDLAPEWREFYAALERMVASPVPGDAYGIPLYKVSSNDGWLVLPGEIATGLRFADKHYADWRDRLTDYVAEFVAWTEQSVPNGGFRVY